VCKCVHICANVRAIPCLYIYVRAHVRVRVRAHLLVRLRGRVCMRVRVCVRVYVWMTDCSCVSVCLSVCLSVFVLLSACVLFLGLFTHTTYIHRKIWLQGSGVACACMSVFVSQFCSCLAAHSLTSHRADRFCL